MVATRGFGIQLSLCTRHLLECYESEAAHQRHFARWAAAFASRMATVLVLKDIHIYGRGLSAVPDEWEPLMSTLENPLERNHKGPVGKT